MWRGLGSWGTPLSAKNPPPLTIVASTLLHAFQRSRPPWVSRILPSSSFIRYLPKMSSLRSPRLTSTLSRAVLCNQHHAEPRLALHHAGVSIRRLFEWHCLDHRSDVLQNTEGERILRINRRSRQAAVDRAPSEHERKRIQLDLVLRYTDHDQLAAGSKTGHKCSHDSTAGSGGQNRSCPTHALQDRSEILDSRIDVDVRAQVFRQFFLFPSPPDRDSTESHVARKLDAEMAKATYALNGDVISAAQAGIAKSVVGCNPRAEQRSGFRGCELIRNRRDAARFGDHNFRIPTIRGYSRYHRVLTIHDVSAPAGFAHPIFSGD